MRLTNRALPTLSQVVTILLGLISTVLLGAWHWAVLISAVLGVASVVLALYRWSRMFLHLALGWFTFAATIAATISVPTEIVLTAMLSAVLAWDCGHRALTLGEQLGHDATTIRIEVAHMAASAVVGVGSITIAYLGAEGFSASYPLISILLLASATVILLYAK